MTFDIGLRLCYNYIIENEVREVDAINKVNSWILGVVGVISLVEIKYANDLFTSIILGIVGFLFLSISYTMYMLKGEY